MIYIYMMYHTRALIIYPFCILDESDSRENLEENLASYNDM